MQRSQLVLYLCTDRFGTIHCSCYAKESTSFVSMFWPFWHYTLQLLCKGVNWFCIYVLIELTLYITVCVAMAKESTSFVSMYWLCWHCSLQCMLLWQHVQVLYLCTDCVGTVHYNVCCYGKEVNCLCTYAPTELVLYITVCCLALICVLIDPDSYPPSRRG